jgi:glycosyltransferase involved in cell wall biosynthesis
MDTNNIKTILISQYALPYSGIGSWTTMYNYYLSQKKNKIDIIIAPPSTEKLENVSYYTLNYSILDIVERKLTGNSYLQIFKILKKIIKPSEKYIIQIIDNHGLVLPLNHFLKKTQFRQNCYIQFFYHGFPPFLGNFESRTFFEALDEHVVLTLDSYKAHKEGYTILPCAFNVLQNGVNDKQFYPLGKNEKAKLRVKYNILDSKLIFIWCSQDKPKKGLDLILKVWKQLIRKYDFIELWIIGSERTVETGQVKNIGRIPNSEIAQYYQLADFYLYPSLCHEGFGLTLVEALKCGCYCIASHNGGIPEVLQYGSYGKLIKNPNMITNWVSEIENSIEEYMANANVNPYLKQIPIDIYSLDTWCKNLDTIIKNAKFSIK